VMLLLKVCHIDGKRWMVVCGCFYRSEGEDNWSSSRQRVTWPHLALQLTKSDPNQETTVRNGGRSWRAPISILLDEFNKFNLQSFLSQSNLLELRNQGTGKTVTNSGRVFLFVYSKPEQKKGASHLKKSSFQK
jgi:hypothetical protein